MRKWGGEETGLLEGKTERNWKTSQLRKKPYDRADARRTFSYFKNQ